MINLSTMFLILCIIAPSFILILGASIFFLEVDPDQNEMIEKQREEKD